MFKYLFRMQTNLKRLLIFGFFQLVILIILSNHIVDGTVNIMGNNAFKLGNKTFMVQEVEGLEFSSDGYYSNAFSQPNASFFFVKEIENYQVDWVLSGTPIRTNDYQDFNDILSDYKIDSTITVFSTEQTSNFLDVKFASNTDSSTVIFARFYQAYPYFFQLLGSWQSETEEMPEELKRALNAVRVTE